MSGVSQTTLQIHFIMTHVYILQGFLFVLLQLHAPQVWPGMWKVIYQEFNVFFTLKTDYAM